MHRGFDKRRKLFVPLLHEGDTLGWHSHEIDQRVYTVDEVGRKVAYHNSAGKCQLVGIASSENEALSVEYAAVGVEAEIVCHDIKSAAIVGELEGVGRYGDVFAFSVGSAR